MEPIGAVLEEMRRSGRLDKGIKVQSLSDVWPAVQSLWDETTIGAYVARNSRPSEFRNGTLTIVCANASIMQVLAEQKPLIVEKLNRQMGMPIVTDLAFGLENVHEVRVQRQQPPAAPAGPADDSLARTVVLTAEQKARAAKMAEGIENPSLRSSFERAYEAWLRWNVWRNKQRASSRPHRTPPRRY
jgi:hypothetical protein